jgi:hypothetical protein
VIMRAETAQTSTPASHMAPFRELREAYSWFYAAFQEAAERWKSGDRNACFPVGSFPPGLPFVSG